MFCPANGGSEVQALYGMRVKQRETIPITQRKQYGSGKISHLPTMLKLQARKTAWTWQRALCKSRTNPSCRRREAQVVVKRHRSSLVKAAIPGRSSMNVSLRPKRRPARSF